MCNKYKWHVRLVKNSTAVYSKICWELIHYLKLKYVLQSLIMSALEVQNSYIKIA